jgi:hypothetical protein
MIFPVVHLDSTSQVNEKIRIDCSQSFVSKGSVAITKLEIEAEASAGYVDVFNADADEWYLDWVYTTAGTKTVSVKITAGTTTTVTQTIEVVSVASDALFSSDNALKAVEPDIMKWLPAGKSTWNFAHRRAQEIILNTLYKNRIYTNDGAKLTKAEVLDVSEVSDWSTYLVLSMIFNGISNAVDDVFSRKSEMYSEKSQKAMNLAFNVLKLDYDKSGTLTSSEKVDLRSGTMVRR